MVYLWKDCYPHKSPTYPKHQEEPHLQIFFTKHGFKMVFKSDMVIFTKYGVFLSKGFATFKIFKLNIINEMSFTSAYFIESCDLKHGRPSHVHYKIKHLTNL